MINQRDNILHSTWRNNRRSIRIKVENTFLFFKIHIHNVDRYKVDDVYITLIIFIRKAILASLGASLIVSV